MKQINVLPESFCPEIAEQIKGGLWNWSHRLSVRDVINIENSEELKVVDEDRLLEIMQVNYYLNNCCNGNLFHRLLEELFGSDWVWEPYIVNVKKMLIEFYERKKELIINCQVIEAFSKECIIDYMGDLPVNLQQAIRDIDKLLNEVDFINKTDEEQKVIVKRVRNLINVNEIVKIFAVSPQKDSIDEYSMYCYFLSKALEEMIREKEMMDYLFYLYNYMFENFSVEFLDSEYDERRNEEMEDLRIRGLV